jgi:hypothetical protein
MEKCWWLSGHKRSVHRRRQLDNVWARLDRTLLFLLACPIHSDSIPLTSWLQLINAREKAEKVVISKDKVIYSTEKDLAEQDIEAADWMGRLRQREEDRSR